MKRLLLWEAAVKYAVSAAGHTERSLEDGLGGSDLTVENIIIIDALENT